MDNKVPRSSPEPPEGWGRYVAVFGTTDDATHTLTEPRQMSTHIR
jgi:hypothetical protein